MPDAGFLCLHTLLRLAQCALQWKAAPRADARGSAAHGGSDGCHAAPSSCRSRLRRPRWISKLPAAPRAAARGSATHGRSASCQAALCAVTYGSVNSDGSARCTEALCAVTRSLAASVVQKDSKQSLPEAQPPPLNQQAATPPLGLPPVASPPPVGQQAVTHPQISRLPSSTSRCRPRLRRPRWVSTLSGSPSHRCLRLRHPRWIKSLLRSPLYCCLRLRRVRWVSGSPSRLRRAATCCSAAYSGSTGCHAAPLGCRPWLHRFRWAITILSSPSPRSLRFRRLRWIRSLPRIPSYGYLRLHSARLVSRFYSRPSSSNLLLRHVRWIRMLPSSPSSCGLWFRRFR